ncbi:UNKNOWN [Stylonychia lemnae]|uniref:Uncharacterized protein n=1 Tax=Stylonychia lemnae TaxID=5949 RepID=A0A078ARR3_STYLE|nr:UNKNOWN [Stylonychia lemnae]|eukprot:CDW83558.1 UNKNOWN [Stylonychia lemnae]
MNREEVLITRNQQKYPTQEQSQKPYKDENLMKPQQTFITTNIKTNVSQQIDESLPKQQNLELKKEQPSSQKNKPISAVYQQKQPKFKQQLQQSKQMQKQQKTTTPQKQQKSLQSRPQVQEQIYQSEEKQPKPRDSQRQYKGKNIQECKHLDLGVSSQKQESQETQESKSFNQQQAEVPIKKIDLSECVSESMKKKIQQHQAFMKEKIHEQKDINLEEEKQAPRIQLNPEEETKQIPLKHKVSPILQSRGDEEPTGQADWASFDFTEEAERQKQKRDDELLSEQNLFPKFKLEDNTENIMNQQFHYPPAHQNLLQKQEMIREQNLKNQRKSPKKEEEFCQGFSLIDKMKFALYNKVYKMIEEQKLIDNPEEIVSQGFKTIQGGKNLMKRMEVAMKKVLEQKKQECLQRKDLKEQETHVRQPSPERIQEGQELLQLRPDRTEEQFKQKQRDINLELIKNKSRRRQRKEDLDFRKQSNLDSEHDEINGWRFQKDRTQIKDNLECGDLACLFDESNVQEVIEPYKMPKQEFKPIQQKFQRKTQIPKKRFIYRPKQVKEEIKVNYPKGNTSFKKKQPRLEIDFRKQSELDSEHDEINGWRFQKDRTQIKDNLEQGDLECLFDESNVQETVQPYVIPKQQIITELSKPIQRQKKIFKTRKIQRQPAKDKQIDSNYKQIGRWRFQIDRSKIFDGFEQGDLENLFDESNVCDTIEDYSKVQKRKIEENYEVLNGWRFQKDRSGINDYFEEGDLANLFDESNVQARIVIPWEPLYQEDLDYKEKLRARNLKKNNKRRRLAKQKDRERLEHEESQRYSLRGYDLFGDPMNLSHKTMCTSEDHLLIERESKLNQFFNRQQKLEKPNQEERLRQSQLDKEKARAKKEQEVLKQRIQLIEKQNKFDRDQQMKQKQIMIEKPKLTLNQKKKIKRKERKLRLKNQERFWESLENAQIDEGQFENEMQQQNVSRFDFQANQRQKQPQYLKEQMENQQRLVKSGESQINQNDFGGQNPVVNLRRQNLVQVFM